MVNSTRWNTEVLQGFFKDKKEDNIAGASQDGFIKSKFFIKKIVNFSCPDIFDW